MKIKFLKNLSIFFILIFSISSLRVYAAEDSEKIIYLTFDDGPAGKITTDVLDILKEENVPGTFFLIGDQIKDQEDLVKRLKEEGHSIGLHSMSHEKSKLYASNDAFLKEMLDSQALIKDITGESPTILRFPCGCNNTCYKLKPELVDLLHKNNLRIFDWNVDTTDGANPYASPSTFINKAKSDKDTIFLLMHCGYQSKNSVKALPEIIKYYKDKGYSFKAIDDDTPEQFHYIKK